MKPPVDWSPCQQKGNEHEWVRYYLLASPQTINNLNDVLFTWVCANCGVITMELDEYD